MHEPHAQYWQCSRWDEVQWTSVREGIGWVETVLGQGVTSTLSISIMYNSVHFQSPSFCGFHSKWCWFFWGLKNKNNNKKNPSIQLALPQQAEDIHPDIWNAGWFLQKQQKQNPRLSPSKDKALDGINCTRKVLTPPPSPFYYSPRKSRLT